MRIYLDVCCLNRPFDDQSQERIRLESEAVVMILGRVKHKIYEWITSDVTAEEVRRTPNEERRSKVLSLLRYATGNVSLNPEVSVLARFFTGFGIRPMDALHLAAAHAGVCELFLKTDDSLLSHCQKVRPQLLIKVTNPARWIAEEIIK